MGSWTEHHVHHGHFISISRSVICMAVIKISHFDTELILLTLVVVVEVVVGGGDGVVVAGLRTEHGLVMGGWVIPGATHWRLVMIAGSGVCWSLVLILKAKVKK